MANTLASDADIEDLIGRLEKSADGTQEVDQLLARHPEDPRLHFMKGSLLAGEGHAIEAHSAMSRSLQLAPEYSLARYQLGFFELTSGEPGRALSTWGPLLAESEDNYLRKFVEGMTHLIRDEFPAAISLFEQGMRLNEENEPMNHDIQLLIAECRKLQARALTTREDQDEHSATSLILSKLGSNRTIQ